VNMPQTAIVCGGGIGGLAAALALHKAGLTVQVYERAPELIEIGAGINMLPAGASVLDMLGMSDRLQSDSGADAVLTSELRYLGTKGTEILKEPRGRFAGFNSPQYSISRATMHKQLLYAVQERIGMDSCHLDHCFERFTQTDDQVTAYFTRSDGTEVCAKADVMIGADGLRSAVRNQIYPGEEARFTGWRIYRGVVELDASLLNGSTMLTTGSGKMAWVFYPISATHAKNGKIKLNWGANCNDEVLPESIRGRPGPEEWNRAANKEEFAPLVKDWSFGEGIWSDPSISYSSIIEATPAENISCYCLFDRDPVAKWTFGRVTLLGDAAHPLLPFGSQGGGQAMLDVQALFDAFSTTDGPAALLAYEQSRVKIAEKVVLKNREMGPTKLLRMLDDECGNKSKAEQDAWVASHAEELRQFSAGYQAMTGNKKVASKL